MHVAALASDAQPQPLLELRHRHRHLRADQQRARVSARDGSRPRHHDVDRRRGGITHIFGGTSSATPLVAGIAALVISANPNLTALEVIALLKRTAAKDLSATGYPRHRARQLRSEPDLGRVADRAVRRRCVPERGERRRNVEPVVRARPRGRASCSRGGIASLAVARLERTSHSARVNACTRDPGQHPPACAIRCCSRRA